jgi:hypothetical protein
MPHCSVEPARRFYERVPPPPIEILKRSILWGSRSETEFLARSTPRVIANVKQTRTVREWIEDGSR